MKLFKSYLIASCHTLHSTFDGYIGMVVTNNSGIFKKPELFNTIEKAEKRVAELLKENNNISYTILPIYRTETSNFNKH